MWMLALLACGSSEPAPKENLTGPGVAHLRHVAPVREVPDGRPNVVLVLGCTVRRDQMGLYGGPATTTPFLDGLAAKGVHFADPIAAAPWTRAAGAAIVSGRHALEVGLVEPGVARNDRRLPMEVDTLAERFADAGWRTVGGTTNPNLNAVFGFDQGFADYFEPSKLWREDAHRLESAVLVEQVLDVLGPAQERPAFVQLMLVDAHAPFYSRFKRDFKEPGLPDAVAAYRGGLHKLDRSVRALRERLEAQGYTSENTLFVFASDHGEGLQWPEHHGKSHGRYLYGSAVEAAWILEGAGLPAGHVIDGVASQIDIGRTLLNLAGAGDSPFGLDFSQAVRRGEKALTGRRFAVADTWFKGSNRVAAYTSGRACLKEVAPPMKRERTGRFVAGCYDRVQDPQFAAPLVEEDAVLMEALTRWRAERAGGPTAPAVDVADGLSEQLRVLGYTE